MVHKCNNTILLLTKLVYKTLFTVHWDMGVDLVSWQYTIRAINAHLQVNKVKQIEYYKKLNIVLNDNRILDHREKVKKEREANDKTNEATKYTTI